MSGFEVKGPADDTPPGEFRPIAGEVVPIETYRRVRAHLVELVDGVLDPVDHDRAIRALSAAERVLEETPR